MPAFSCTRRLLEASTLAMPHALDEDAGFLLDESLLVVSWKACSSYSSLMSLYLLLTKFYGVVMATNSLERIRHVSQ